MSELISTFPLCGWNTDLCVFSVWVWDAAAPTAASRRTSSPWLHCFLASYWLLVAISYTVHLPSLVYWKIASGSKRLLPVLYVMLVPARVLFQTTSPVFIWVFHSCSAPLKWKNYFWSCCVGFRTLTHSHRSSSTAWRRDKKRFMKWGSSQPPMRWKWKKVLQFSGFLPSTADPGAGVQFLGRLGCEKKLLPEQLVQSACCIILCLDQIYSQLLFYSHLHTLSEVSDLWLTPDQRLQSIWFTLTHIWSDLCRFLKDELLCDSRSARSSTRLISVFQPQSLISRKLSTEQSEVSLISVRTTH